MKSRTSKLMKRAPLFLAVGLFLFVITEIAFAQSVEDMLKGTAKQGARQMLGVGTPIQGQAEMMDGANTMMQGRQTLRTHLLKTGKLKEGEAMEGGAMLTEGHRSMTEGDKLIKAGDTVQGKKKMLDGCKTMSDAKKMMLEDLYGRRMLERVSTSEGETMMNDGEKMMKKGEMMMLK